jgi:hypothetical protein
MQLINKIFKEEKPVEKINKRRENARLGIEKCRLSAGANRNSIPIDAIVVSPPST